MQQEIHDDPTRFRVVAAGRRVGKSTLAIDEAVDAALAGKSLGWFAPAYNYLDDPWRKVKLILADLITDKSEQQHRIALKTGGMLDFWTMDSDDPGRGREYDLVVIDEASLVKDLRKKFYDAINPTLVNRRGRVLMLGTPKGRNDFYSFFVLGGKQKNWRSWQAPSSANPFIPPEELADAKERMPEASWRQEHMAEFIEEGAGVFRFVDRVATALPQGPVVGHEYFIGVDWGRSADFTVYSVFDRTTRAQVFLDRFTRIETEYQLMRLHALYDRYRQGSGRHVGMLAEENQMGIVMIDQMQRRGVPCLPWRATTTTKNPVIDALASVIERQVITLLADPILIGELMAYEMERLPSGILRYNAPKGQHDDTVIATALSVVAAMVPEQETIQMLSFRVE